jgi:pimeloyl-ACP methyl ester carboxylesterase
VKASAEWFAATANEFSAGSGIAGCAQLTHYTAQYCEWGDGPPLILVPGMAGGFELLGPLARLLSRHFRVISYQLRGEDDCFALRRPFDLDDLVEDLAEFVDWLCLESPTVMGVSFGGLLALEFAARFPGRLDRLVVQGAGVRFEKGLVQQVASTVLSRFPLPADNAFVNQFFNLLFGAKQDDDALFAFVTRQCWQTDQSVMAHRFRLVERYNMLGKLRKVRVPTLVMAGDRDVLISRRSVALLCDGLPSAHLARLPGCGHLAFITRPDMVAEQVQRFLLS